MSDSPPVLKRNWILAALMLTMFLAAMDITVVSTVIPKIVEDIGGFKKFSWVFSIYLLTQTATIPLYGKFADLYGRKRVLLIGIGIFLLGSACSASSWDITSLITFRGIQGIGAGSILAMSNTIAGDIYSVQERAKIQGWLSSIWGISAILGPVLGGGLAKYLSWRWIFLINIPVGLVAGLLLILYLKEKVKKEKHRIDYAGAGLIFSLLTVLIVFLLYGGQSWPWISFESLGLLLISLILLLLTMRIERRAEEPVMPGWLWTDRTFLGSNLAVVGLGIIMMGPETYLPTFMQASLGFGVIVSGLILSAMSIGWPTASALSGKIYLSIGFRNTALIGTLLIILSCVGFLFIPWPQPIYLLVIDQIFFGAGMGLLSTPALVGIQFVVGWEKRGVVTGANQFCRYLGQSLGAAIFGAVFNSSYLHQINHSSLSVSEDTGNILRTLQEGELTQQVRTVIKQALNTANHHIYIGMIATGLLTIVAVFVIPKKLKTKA